MPRIPDELLSAVAFIFPSEADALAGTQVGGSGFVFYMESGVGTWKIRYVITNQHVLAYGGYWVRVNRPGGTSVVHVPEHEWTRAPDGDDFAVAPLRLPRGYTAPMVGLEPMAVTRQMAEELNVGAGDTAFMVGRFMGHGKRLTNNPVVRFGNIALMPNVLEPLRDERGIDVEAYLVEMRSHAGFSGSAVYLLIPAFTFRGVIGQNPPDTNVTKWRLLGIDTGHLPDAIPVEVKNEHGDWVNVPRHRVAHNSDMAVVAPIWKVVELMEREDMVKQRRRAGEELQEQYGDVHVKADVSLEPDEDTEAAERTITKADFEAALRKVSRRKPSPPDEGTSGT